MPIDQDEQVSPPSAAAWGDWLAANSSRSAGVWLVTSKRATGRQEMTYEESVVEALRFGWIDSVKRSLDADRSAQRFSPRRPGSGWARTNKRRIAQLEAEGRLEPAGRAAVEAAKADGSWSLLDDVEALVVPDDLAAALDARPGGRAGWDAMPPSARRVALEGIALARRDETRARRVASAAADAAAGRRPGRR